MLALEYTDASAADRLTEATWVKIAVAKTYRS